MAVTGQSYELGWFPQRGQRINPALILISERLTRSPHFMQSIKILDKSSVAGFSLIGSPLRSSPLTAPDSSKFQPTSLVVFLGVMESRSCYSARVTQT